MFGPAWTDDYAGLDGRDGCDTRNNVLSRQLVDPVLKAGTRHCVVIAGRLHDPYTGRWIEFHKQKATQVQIDHVYPLARAWDMGAAYWTPSRRIEFANDIARNLLAVSGTSNASKADQGPGEWLPLNQAFRCTYIASYLRVAHAYDLPITADDRTSATAIARSCPTPKGQ